MSSLIERFGRSVPAGQVLFREGDPGTEMFVIQSGRVRLTRTIRGQDKLLAELGPGEFFGEMSIINDKPRTATAVIAEDAQLLVLDPKTFEAMIKANTEIAVRMIKKLAKRLDDANAQIENLLLGDANSRVVHALLLQARTTAPDEKGAVRIPLGAADLAQRTNVEDTKVVEVLERLERSRLVLAADGGVVVPDPAKLVEFLEFLEMRHRYGDL
ncbi:MAG: cyclic nucleotide-binding protein [Deltaproteobacteria bacterium RBG_16_71_12]|nr:MAG: cyclic nucleotide-binding protein [Deltaproteobacteria bacterium RBG_16_71_12]